MNFSSDLFLEEIFHYPVIRIENFQTGDDIVEILMEYAQKKTYLPM